MTRTPKVLTWTLVVLLVTVTLSNVISVSATAQTLTATHPIEYHIGCPPSMVNDGSLDYFKAHGFSTVHLVVSDKGTYQAELNKIKSLGMKPIIDVEIPIWNGGQYANTPITSYASYFQSLQAAGWEYVASEGGRQGDANYLTQFFKGYVNYNCDQCGLWKDMYKETGTVMNSWESYYTTEWPYIQQGAKEAASLGKQNGLLAGTWEYGTDGADYNPILTNSKNGGSPSYQSMLDWSYASGCGFTHFHVWCGNNAQGLSRYKALGFEQIVGQLQVSYPATNVKTSTSVALSVSNPTPTIGQSITFTAQLSWWDPGMNRWVAITSGKPVQIYHTINGVRTNDVTKTTDANGKLTFTTSSSAPSQRTYYASFAGDTLYNGSTSAAKVVTWKATTFSISTSTTAPSVNVPYTLYGNLTLGATPLAGQPVHLERRSYANGAWSGWYDLSDTFKNTDSAGKVSVTQTVAGVATFQYRWHFKGTATYWGAYSPAVNVTIKKPATLTITTSPATPVYNNVFTLSGTLKTGTTGLVGLSVHLERKVGTGAWADVTGTTKTTTTGGVIPSISQTMTTHTTYSYRWHFTGTGTYQSSYSGTKTFTA